MASPFPVGSLGLPLRPTEYSDYTGTTLWVHSELRSFLETTDAGKQFADRASDAYETYKAHEKPNFAGGVFPVSQKQFVDWYTNYANQTSEGKASDAVERYVSSDHFSSVFALWISGIEVEEGVCLTDEFQLRSHQDMPLTTDSLKFARDDWEIGYPWPKCAVAKTIKVEKQSRADGRPFESEFDHLLDISRLINLIPGLTSVPVLQTNTPLAIPEQNLFGGGGLMFPRHPFNENFELFTDDHKSSLEALLADWSARSESTKRRLRRSIDRLASAKHHQDIRDRFLDLAIALEILLLHDNTNHVQLSLSFRLHGALLLGGDLDTKKANQKMLGELYNYRSAVAHQGTLGKAKFKEEGENWETLLAKFEALSTTIIRKLVEVGLPDWNQVRLSGKIE